MTDLGNPWPKGLERWRRNITPALSTRVGILHHAKIVSEVLILHSRQRLGDNVHYFFIYGYVLELHRSSLHHVSDVVVFDLYML
jgi:hypothetical protein